MIKGKKVLGIIPARGGSKGVPGKNTAVVGSKPLVAWTIDSAKSSVYLDRLILSSDDSDAISVAEQAGCEIPFVRPKVLAKDTSTSAEVVEHALSMLEEEFDIAVLLQPTSPFRTALDIDSCIEKCLATKTSCVSVVKLDKSPSWMYTLEKNGKLKSYNKDEFARRRQDATPTYMLNGAVYAFHVRWFQEKQIFVDSQSLAYEMPEERSLDIDSKSDLEFCRYLAEAKTFTP